MTMKSILLSVFLCLTFWSTAQMAFTYEGAPRDFAILVVRKSPVGEFFIQSANPWHWIYTSTNGLDWNEDYLISTHQLNDIQYYLDGTPLMKPKNRAHIIRRDGQWTAMDAGGTGFVETSFLKDDTLFIFKENRFAYSLDKG